MYANGKVKIVPIYGYGLLIILTGFLFGTILLKNIELKIVYRFSLISQLTPSNPLAPHKQKYRPGPWKHIPSFWQGLDSHSSISTKSRTLKTIQSTLKWEMSFGVPDSHLLPVKPWRHEHVTPLPSSEHVPPLSQVLVVHALPAEKRWELFVTSTCNCLQF